MRRLLLALVACFSLTTPAHAAWVWPVRGEVITPYRNGTDPYATGQHRGIDIAASVGTPVVAAVDGDVRFAGTAGSSGLTISIRTGDGYDTSYLHLSALAVRAGAHVSTGERIGAVGTTGTRSATVPHLHVGVRDAGTRHAYHDPLAFLPPPPVAPDPSPPTPAPSPSPEPARPAPMPTPAPMGAPAPRSAPAPRGVPAPQSAPATRPSPVPRIAPRTHVAPSPHAGSSPSRAGLSTAAPESRISGSRVAPEPGQPSPVSTRRRNASVDHKPDPVKGKGFAADQPGPQATPLHSANAHRTAPDSVGPDIGWALACGGLLLAAAILGMTGDGRRTASRTTARIADVLRPLAGRR
jgi:pyruvate/2-oxoglutarate dehydrogenase complex dihydrolipoamide acyltransferase (E2) component